MTSPSRQSGASLLIFLSLLLLIASLALLRTTTQQSNTELHLRLQRAKEALIARAVTDANRPGSLPCPDLITNDHGLSNFPNDGKADNLTRNDCPAYTGWLPWITLDLPELTDESGTRFWYALARSLRDDDLAQPINSDTASSLMLDGRNDIAALIIAPGAAINGQSRPTNHPPDYLESKNTNVDSAFISSPAGGHFNDITLALTRQELMSAVEQRVASEVRACLEQHVIAHPTRDYPWPAPFSASDHRGQAGSYFGQIPLTQPGGGPQLDLEASSKKLQESHLRLSSASAPVEQLTALQALNEQLSYARILYDRLYSTTKELALIAKTSHLDFSALNSTLVSANSNGRISVTERKTIQSEGNDAQAQLKFLQTAVSDAGIDVFPDELATRLLLLQTRIAQANATPDRGTFGLLKDAADALHGLLNRTLTPNTEINQHLAKAQDVSMHARVSAQNAADNSDDRALPGLAIGSAQVLDAAAQSLQRSIADNRVTLHPDEISAHLSRLETQLEAFSQQTETQTKESLQRTLSEARELISRFGTQSSTLLPLRSSSLNSIDQAIATSSNSSNPPLFISSTRNAITETRLLAMAITRHGDNLTLESLKQNLSHFDSQLATFNTIVTRTQAEMTPYAENLRLAAVNLQFWAEIIHRHSSHIATLARKSPDAGKTQNNAEAAHTQADITLSGINKSTGTLKKLQDLVDDPGKSSKQSAASTAIKDTLNQVDKVLSSAGKLEDNLHSSHADAFPMLWYGSRCNFLQPGTDNASWWLANQWSNTIFYQISHRKRGNEGELTINGIGKYPHVVMSAGQKFQSQDRRNRASAEFFETGNADVTRDSKANNPIRNFVKRSATSTFNDQLAF